jgi:hypothetical protein
VRGSGTHTAQASWNGDKCMSGDGSFVYDPTLGTPAMIKYPYLGYGNIQFYLQNPDTSRWVLVHTIKYANSKTTTQLSNPNLYFLNYTANSGNTTNRTMYVGSYGVFLSGARSYIGNPQWGVDNNKASITTETNIVSIKNCTSYNGNPNRGLIRINSISIGSSIATGVVVLRIKSGVTLGGVPAYTARDGTTADNGVTITAGNSIASFDVAGTTITGGKYIFNVTAMNGSSTIDVTPFEIFIAPGEVLTFSAFSTSVTTIGVSINWSEDS